MNSESIELKDRQIINFLQPGLGAEKFIISFGVAIGNDEAQQFIKKDYRVFGDDEGPYLVIRVPSGQSRPVVSDTQHCDVIFRPLRWTLDQGRETGIICWLEEAI